jgi:23S rRNA (cytosine1962-C5)-methyltransferase
MAELSKVILKSGKDQSLMRYHPWVFSGAIKKIHGNPQEGDRVDVYNNRDEFLATGHYQNSSIAVRVLDFNKIDDPASFYNEKIRNAFNLRKNLGLAQSESTSVYRLVNAEGDGLPGLIIDHYDGTLVIQMHSAGMFRDIELIIDALKSIDELKIKQIYNKSESTLPFKAGIEVKDGSLSGGEDLDEIIVKEYLNKFYIDVRTGQKTGFFIDQRENRRLLGEYSKDRRVLNMFGYTGGFSVYALQGGAQMVHTVDASSRAVEYADKNLGLNYPESGAHQSFASDVFDFFKSPPEKYDLIILDPPAFAKHHNVLSNALQGYKKITR